QVTSALQPLDSTVHHLRSTSGDPSTTVSWLLLGLPQLLPVADVSAMLDDVVRRVYEVISIHVQDVNECSYDELNACSAGEPCANLEGSYQCVCPQGSPLASAPQELDHMNDDGAVLASPEPSSGNLPSPLPAAPEDLHYSAHCCDCPPISDFVVLNVSSSSFHVSWRVNSTRNLTFHVQVFRGQELLRSVRTQGLGLAVAGLEAGAVYRVKTSYQGCGNNVSAVLTVKTDARVFEVTIRIVNRNLTEKLLNPSSVEYQDFSRQLLLEVQPAVSALHHRGKLRLQIVSLRAGSVVVRLRLTVQDPEFPVGVSTLSPMLQHLLASTVFQIDQRGTHVQDWDECADSSEHDCSPAARCINLEGSYTCQCLTTRDANPSRVGRACEVHLAFQGALQTQVLLSTHKHQPRQPCPTGRIRVSNVTSTGFHLAWAAGPALHPTFQILLISTRGPAVGLETWNTRHQAGSWHRVYPTILLMYTDKQQTKNNFKILIKNSHPTYGESYISSFFWNTLHGLAQARHRPSASQPSEPTASPAAWAGAHVPGDSPGRTTQAPDPDWLRSPAGTRAALMQGAISTPHGPPPRLNLTGAVRVLCEIEKVAIAIQKRFLQQESVLLVAGWGECGTVVQSNTTNTVVRTTLRNDPSPEVVMHSLKILSPIRCAFQNDLLASSGYTPQWGVYTIIEDLHGAGNFVTEMQLFIGDSPIPQNYSVSASDDVKIEVGLYRQKSGLKVVLTECWATPSSNARDPITFGFINNSCPVPNTYTSVIENGNSNKAQFKLKIFSFINNSIVYLHCKLRVCMESPGATCRINCNDFRLLKSSENSVTYQTSWGPLLRSEGESPGAEAGLGAGYFALIVVAIFVLLAGTAALLIARFRRMTRKYNVKIQADNFSYQAFHK
uniref:Uromodulin like 1 n=1 Tax=Otolemur garnettii TaxID=30611 RepID=H0WT32_OTOGA